MAASGIVHSHYATLAVCSGQMNLSIEPIKTHYERYDTPTNHLRH